MCIMCGFYIGFVFILYCVMIFLKVLFDEDGRVMVVDEGMGSWLIFVFVLVVVMEICIVGLEKCIVVLVLNEKFEFGVVVK